MYYPLNKISAGLYTSGAEFYLVETSVEYKGYYFSTYDGKYFTGKTPTPDSIEIKKYSSDLISTPTLKALNYNNSIQTPSSVVHYTAVPTSEDYKAGSFIRYFAKKVNSDMTSFVELSKDGYDSLATDPLYAKTFIKWKLTGPAQDVKINGILMPGVATLNRKAIEQAETIIPGISSYLNNPIQYLQ